MVGLGRLYVCECEASSAWSVVIYSSVSVVFMRTEYLLLVLMVVSVSTCYCWTIAFLFSYGGVRNVGTCWLLAFNKFAPTPSQITLADTMVKL